MSKRLVKIINLALLLLCVASVALWIRSRHTADVLRWRILPRWEFRVAEVDGIVAVDLYKDPREAEMPDRFPHWLIFEPQNVELLWKYHLGGVGFRFARPVAVYFPLLAIVPVSVVAAWWVWRSNRRMRIPGVCRRCGYDLRATPERCPECGERVRVIMPSLRT